MQTDWQTDSLALTLSSLHLNSKSSVCISADVAPIHLSISHYTLPSLMYKIPRYFYTSTWGSSFLAKKLGLKLRGPNFHPCFFILSFKPAQCKQQVRA